MKKNHFKSHWLWFINLATWLLAITSTFLIEPPLLSLNDSTNYQTIARFILASLVALTFILLRKRSEKKYYSYWLRISLAAAFFSVVLGLSYSFLVNNWSVNFYGQHLIVGEHLYDDAMLKRTSVALELNRTHINDETLVKAYAGDTAAIWPIQEITIRYFLITALYILEIVFISGFMMSISKAITCYTLKDDYPT